MTEHLQAALVEVERHVGRSGWDQPARLFALVRTADLVAAEPSLAEHLSNGPGEGFTSIEQEDFRAGDDLGTTLARIAWPATVQGCVLTLERFFLPPALEADIPEDPELAATFVASHPARLELRVVVGVTRAAEQSGIARLRSSGDLLGGPDLVPALAAALSRTLD